MSWRRFHRSPPTAIFFRFNRHRLDIRARVRVLEEDDGFATRAAGERSFHGCHPLLSLCSVSTKSKYSMMPTNCIHRLFTTKGSVNQQEVMKAFQHFLSSVTDVTTLSMKEMCNIYIENLVRSGNLTDSVYLLGYLHSREIHLDLITYNILLNAASEANSFDIFAEIFKKLLLSSMPPDFTSYVNAAKAFHKMSDTNQLLKFIRDVSEITTDREPTVMNRIIFITAKSGQLDKSLLLFTELKNLKARMDTVTFNTVLLMLGRAGIVDQMLSEFRLMKDLGHSPDIITYNTLINCLRRLGRFDMCKDFAKEMVERGINFDLRTYTALIDAFGRAGHVNDAMRIFSEMRKSQCPSVYVYRAMISNLRKAGKFELALNLLEDMNSNTVKLIGPEEFKRKKKRGKLKVDLGGS
ncbi:SPX domain-containing membrane protein-like [Iris pallida]|uniref:SPX domain-containing membrane protein-like n=1 Tax=Iris pallida TaxID=29817 RepID=A0AAX6HM17_IRIPA|nr:SPX domain-containing membrane protein-like [Iris pallida]